LIAFEDGDTRFAGRTVQADKLFPFRGNVGRLGAWRERWCRSSGSLR
jgi:hypothetical protein